jgi:hypothetical protein
MSKLNRTSDLGGHGSRSISVGEKKYEANRMEYIKHGVTAQPLFSHPAVTPRALLTLSTFHSSLDFLSNGSPGRMLY